MITQSKSFHLLNTHLFSSYNVALIILLKFGLQVEHSKTEVFHFSRYHSTFNPSPLDLSSIGGPLLIPKDTWKYLGFIFDRKLCFHKHINYYANKAISIVKCMKILSNLTRGLNPQQKHLLYRSCALPIALYGFQLWFYSKALLSYPLNLLDKLQRRAAIWILGAFKMSPAYNIEAIVGLILICLHLQKLSNRSQLRGHTLPANHIIRTLLDNSPNSLLPPHDLSLAILTKRQCGLLKSHIVDINNRFNEVFPAFDPINPELQPGNRIIDTFPNCFSFYTFSRSNDPSFKSCIQQLDALAIEFSTSSSNALAITDASVKNNVALSIVHIHVFNKPVVKTLHHTVNITSSEAKFFTIRCGINHTVVSHETSKIIIVIDSIHVAKKIFDPSLHMLQKQAAFILSELREFFNHCNTNTIEFWECPSKSNWHLHKAVNLDTKLFNLTPLLPDKCSWDFSKKLESDNIINTWKMTFQALDLKGRNFLELVDSDNNTLEPTYFKGGSWLQVFGHSNLLCAKATRAITNHALIGEYCLKFFPNEDFSCLCGLYPIETRRHILHECRRFNKYWNPRSDSIAHFIQFLERNLRAFSFMSS